MALKTDQAKVLRRRVLGGLARNLILFTAAFLAVGLALEALVVPRIAEEVADSTSVWRSLNSTEQFNTALAEYGLLDTDLFANEAKDMAQEGFSTKAGSISAATSELDALNRAMEAYTDAVAAGTPASEAARAVLETYLQDTTLYRNRRQQRRQSRGEQLREDDRRKRQRRRGGRQRRRRGHRIGRRRPRRARSLHCL